ARQAVGVDVAPFDDTSAILHKEQPALLSIMDAAVAQHRVGPAADAHPGKTIAEDVAVLDQPRAVLPHGHAIVIGVIVDLAMTHHGSTALADRQPGVVIGV